MRNGIRPTFIALLLLLLLAPTVRGQAQASEDRIVQTLTSSKFLPLAGTIHPLARSEYDHGPISSTRLLSGLTLDFKRSTAQQSALQLLLSAQQDPSSPKYHKWLTQEQFGDQFGVSQDDLAKTASWLQAQGFTIAKIADSRNSIRFNGAAGQVEQAFHTHIHSYLVGDEPHYANSTQVSLPAAIAGMVDRVGGLNDFRPKPRVVKQSGKQSAKFTSGVSGAHYMAPGDFSLVYDVKALYSGGFTGSGQTIGIVGQTDIVMADITAFRSAAGLPANNPTVYLIPGSADPGIGDVSGDLNETDLDLEWSGAVAKNASIVLINSTDALGSLQYAIGNKINTVQIPILSSSYGDCETNYTSADLASLEASFQQANAQGQTIIGPAGDTGAADCDDSSATQVVNTASHGLQVDYPASSAYVTGLGGSEFTGDGTAANPDTGPDKYWAANGSADLVTSALSYIPEMGWNDTTVAAGEGGGLSAGGGGASTLYARPSWQTGVAGIPTANHRDVPDVSLNASAYHDPYLVCTQIVLDSDPSGKTYTSSCKNGFRIADTGYDDDGGVTAFGGTSAAAPGFAGILALIEQKLGAQQGLGNINPTLYSLASNATTYASAFHDIQTGNNIVPCVARSTDCPSNGELGYSAGVGYDQVTGLGSVDATKLAAAFASLATKAGSTPAITIAPASPTVGTAVLLTATIAANSGTDVPTGTAAFTVDGVALGTVTLNDAVASISETFSAGGSHTISVTYSGDANFSGSTASIVVNVTAAASAAATATTVSASPTSIALGVSVNLTATVQSSTAGTLAGSVTFTLGSTSLGTAALTPGASGTGTASLSVAAATVALGFTTGSNTITATYGGDTSYSGSTGTTTIIVNNPGITMTIPSMTISSPIAGTTGSSSVTLASTGGYAGTVNLSATATSLNANYSLAATTLALTSGGTASTTINIQTVAANSQSGLQNKARTTPNRGIAAAGLGLGSLCLLLIPGLRRKRWSALFCFLMLAGISGLMGCGGSSIASGASPAGNYTVTVTAADSSNAAITTSTSFTVTIQ